MYLKLLNLNQPLFSRLARASEYFPFTAHEQARREILGRLGMNQPIVSLNGRAGVGKTLLVNKLLEERPSQIKLLMLRAGAARSLEELYRMMLFDWGVDQPPHERASARRLFLKKLEEVAAEGSHTLAVFEEVHLYPREVIDEITALTRLATQSGFGFQVLLVEREAVAISRSMKALADRPRPHGSRSTLPRELDPPVTLAPVPKQELLSFWEQRCKRAGRERSDLFTAEATELLLAAADGLPGRLISHVEHSLWVAVHHEMRTVTLDSAEQARDQFQVWQSRDRNGRQTTPPANMGVVPMTLPISSASTKEHAEPQSVPTPSSNASGNNNPPVVVFVMAPEPAAKSNSKTAENADRAPAMPKVAPQPTFGQSKAPVSPPSVAFPSQEKVSDNTADKKEGLRELFSRRGRQRRPA